MKAGLRGEVGPRATSVSHPQDGRNPRIWDGGEISQQRRREAAPDARRPHLLLPGAPSGRPRPGPGHRSERSISSPGSRSLTTASEVASPLTPPSHHGPR